MFILLLAFSAVFIAGCAAFFSIKGLILLFSGSPISVGIMAAALELGKLTAASFLHNSWGSTGKLLKSYLCIAIFVLMGITSLGIFGFLTNAYQIHSSNVKVYETDLTSLEAQKTTALAEVEENKARIQSLTDLRKDQEERVKAAGNYKAPREQAYKAIEEANKELELKESRQVKLREKIDALQLETAEVQKSLNTKTDIGSFKFIAEAFDSSIDSTVRVFILCLVFVFDPLAVTLILALNQLIGARGAKKKEPTPVCEIPQEIILPAQVEPDLVVEPVVEVAAEPSIVDLAQNNAFLNEEELKLVERYRKNRKMNPDNGSIITG